MFVLEANSKLKENLLDLENGYYISKSDPLFWRKLLNRRSENGEAMYHVGLELETEAKKYLDNYYITKIEKHLIRYRKVMRQSYDLLRNSLSKGFVLARQDVLRIEKEMKSTDKDLSLIKRSRYFTKKSIIVLFILAFIIGLLTTLFITFNILNIINYSNSYYTYMLPYEVIDKKPTSIPFGNYQVKNIKVEKSVKKEVIVNELIKNIKIEYEKDSKSAKQIIAIDESKEEIGMALWAGGDKNIQVYIYPSNSTASTSFIDNQERQLWETSTVVRSAIYQFVKQNGYLPNKLNTLNQPFPNNYLTDLPKDPYKFKNNVATSPTEDGGWLFASVEISLNPNSDLSSAVKDAVKPNIPYDKDIPFVPLSIIIDMKNHILSVMSGTQIIREYPVALGKDGATPEGDFYISKKVMNPDKIVPKSDNVYGTRAMELSNKKYAIHGTNTPTSIGQDVSAGCIRLDNSDMEDLYAIIPLNTAVNISKNPITSNNSNNLYTPNRQLYNHSDSLKEEDNSKMYHWGE